MKKIFLALVVTVIAFTSCKKEVAQKVDDKNVVLIYKINTQLSSKGSMRLAEKDTVNPYNYNLQTLLESKFPTKDSATILIPKDIRLFYNSSDNLNYSLTKNGITIENGIFTDPVSIFDYSFNYGDTVILKIF